MTENKPGGSDTDDLREQVARAIAAGDTGSGAHWSDMSDGSHDLYLRFADHALSVVAPELARLREENERLVRPNYDASHEGLAIISDGTPAGQIKALVDSLRVAMAGRDVVHQENERLREELSVTDGARHEWQAFGRAAASGAAQRVVERDEARAQLAKAVALLRKTADGRREYAASTDGQAAEDLQGEAATLDIAARIVEGDDDLLRSLLPSWRWPKPGGTS